MTVTTKNKAKPKNILSGLVWIFTGTIGVNIVQFFSLAILARLLEPRDFGVVAASMVIIGLITIFADLGVAPAVVQKENLSKKDIGTASLLSLIFGLIAGCVVYFISNSFESFMDMEGLADIVKTLALVLPLAGLTVIGQALLQKKLKFKALALCSFISNVSGKIFIAIPLAYMGFGYWSLVWGILGQTILLMLLVHILVPEIHRYTFNKISSKALMNYGVGQSLGKLANYTSTQIDKLVIGKYLGASLLGGYERGYSLMMIPASLFGTTIDKVLFPVMSDIQNNNKKIAQLFVLATSLMAMVSVPISIFFILFSPDVIALVLGDGWEATIPVLQVLGAIIFFRMSYKLSDSLVRAKGAVYRRAWRQAIYALFVLLGVLIGLKWGVTGASIGVGAAITMNYFVMLLLSNNLIDFRWDILNKIFAKYLLAFLVVILFCSTLSPQLVKLELNLFIKVILEFIFTTSITALFYILLYPLFKEELQLIMDSFKKITRRK